MLQVACVAGLMGRWARAEFEFGEKCSDDNDKFCQLYDCNDCRMSWPTGERRNRINASCRCADDVKKEWKWGGKCKNLTDWHCSSVNC